MPARTTTPTDAAELARALAFGRRQLRGACERAIVHPFGEAFVDTRLPRAHVLNALHVDAEVDADQLAAALDDLYAGYAHRRADVEVEDTGARLAPDLRRRGWQAERDAVMALRRPRDRDGDRALAREADAATHREVDAATVRGEPFGRDEEVVRQLVDMRAALRRPRDRDGDRALAREADAATHREVDAATVRGEPFGRDEEVVRQLVDMRAALAAAVPVTRFFVGTADGVDAAVTTLYSDGAVAQIEDVVTLAGYRGRGLARAMLTLALDAAAEMGHELVFIVADDDDWPKDLYGRLGFDVVGHTWAFTRTERRAGG